MTEIEYKSACSNISLKASCFVPIIEEVMRPLSGSIDFSRSEITMTNELVAFDLISNHGSLPFTMVFWIRPFRLSLLLDKHEVSDDYLGSEKDVKNQINFIRLLLDNEITEIISKNSKGKVLRRSFHYPIIDSEGVQRIVEDTIFSKFSWFQKMNNESISHSPWFL